MEQLLKAFHLTETAARLKGFTYRAGQKMRKYLKQIFRDIGIAEKKPRWTDMRLNYQLTQRTKHSIVRTSSNGEEQAYAVPYEKPDIIGN